MNDSHYPDYDFARQLLARENCQQQISEVHGMLTGLLVAGGFNSQTWTSEVIGTETGGQGDRATGELANLFTDLQRATAAQLSDPQLAFQLYLADDNCGLRERTETLAQWCQGFIYGVGVSGLAADWMKQSTNREFLEDVSAIANAVSAQSDDQGETAFVELVEYVRVGVMLLHTELEVSRRKVAMH